MVRISPLPKSWDRVVGVVGVPTGTSGVGVGARASGVGVGVRSPKRNNGRGVGVGGKVTGVAGGRGVAVGIEAMAASILASSSAKMLSVLGVAVGCGVAVGIDAMAAFMSSSTARRISSTLGSHAVSTNADKMTTNRMVPKCSLAPPSRLPDEG